MKDKIQKIFTDLNTKRKEVLKHFDEWRELYPDFKRISDVMEYYNKNELLAEYNMDNKDFTQLMKIVKDHTKSNNDKAKAIANIRNGAEIVIGLLGKLL